MHPMSEAVVERLKTLDKSLEKQREVAQKFIDEGMNPISAFIIAGDILSRQNADVAVEEGWDWADALELVGSYARFDWAYENRHLTTTEHFYAALPDLWVNSDPDDTKPEYLDMWWRAFVHNGRKTITTADSPLPDQKSFTIWRGQKDEPITGVSWSLNRKVAEKFAITGGLRQPIPNGILYKARVKREHIWAYFTHRSEDEVIVSPFHLITVR